MGTKQMKKSRNEKNAGRCGTQTSRHQHSGGGVYHSPHVVFPAAPAAPPSPPSPTPQNRRTQEWEELKKVGGFKKNGFFPERELR